MSIVVPSFQQGRYLPFALEGPARQTFGPVETAVYDNVSTDSSEDVLRLYEGKVSRIVRARDRGQADALRRGFTETSADLLGWLNADDMLLPDTIERVTAIFRERPDVDVVYGDCAFLSETGQFIGYFHDIQDFDARDLLNFSDFIPQPSTFFRRSAYEACGGIDTSLEFAMDWDLWCRMARAGRRFLRVHEVLAAARIHRNAKTSSGGLRRSREIWKVNRRHAWGGIPFVAAAQIYHRYVRRYAGPLALLPRFAWSTVLGAPRANTRVQGFEAGLRPSGGLFRVRFPVFSNVREVRVRHAPGSEVSVETPRGPLAHGTAFREADVLGWSLSEPAFLQEIDLRGALVSGPAAAVAIEWK